MRPRLQVAFVTGQSDPARCALSPVQRAFLDQLPVPPEGRVAANFPYAIDADAHRDVPLLIASWHNVAQYTASRRSGFAMRHQPAVLRMLNGADHTILLAGSCGLELLVNLELPAPVLRRIHVFAYGAVARRRPGCDLLIVRGRHDWLAAAARLGTDHVVDAFHRDYLTSPEVLEHCRGFVQRVDRELSGESA
jgi:hypothetical protein